jgi:hypothetical protein
MRPGKNHPHAQQPYIAALSPFVLRKLMRLSDLLLRVYLPAKRAPAHAIPLHRGGGRKQAGQSKKMPNTTRSTHPSAHRLSGNIAFPARARDACMVQV